MPYSTWGQKVKKMNNLPPRNLTKLLKNKNPAKSPAKSPSKYETAKSGGMSKFQNFGTPHLFIMGVKIKAFMGKWDNYALH